MKTSFTLLYFCSSVSLLKGLQAYTFAKEGEIEYYNEKGVGWVADSLPPGVTLPGACLDPSKITLQADVDPKFIGRPRNYYYSGGSKYGMGLYAQAFLGRNPNSLYELGEMCPEVFILNTDVRFVSGYGRMFQADCFLQDSNTTIKCYRNKNPDTFDEGVDPKIGIHDKKYYLVKTDNKSYLIFVTCVNDQYADFQLVTTRQYVSPYEASEFVKIIKEYGFPLDQALLLACKIHPGFSGHYPYPFKNYPRSPSDYQSDPGYGNGWSPKQESSYA